MPDICNMKRTFFYALAAIVMFGFACKDKQATSQTATAEPTLTADSKGSITSVEEVKWMTIEEAIVAQEEDPKPIMVDVFTKWCGPCKMLSKNTLEDARVSKYLSDNYYCVKFDAESPDTVFFANNLYTNPDYVPNQAGRNGVHQFARFLNVSAYPTLFFFDKKAQALGPLTGYRTPAQIEIFLHYFAEDKYLTVQTPEQWTEYEKAFVVTWN